MLHSAVHNSFRNGTEASRGLFTLSDKCATAPIHRCVGPDLSTEARGPVSQRERGTHPELSVLIKSDAAQRVSSISVCVSAVHEAMQPEGDGEAACWLQPRDGSGGAAATLAPPFPSRLTSLLVLLSAVLRLTLLSNPLIASKSAFYIRLL